jgi:hypothetical protein
LFYTHTYKKSATLSTLLLYFYKNHPYQDDIVGYILKTVLSIFFLPLRDRYHLGIKHLGSWKEKLYISLHKLSVGNFPFINNIYTDDGINLKTAIIVLKLSCIYDFV